jgi:hypothetical protein
MLNETTCVRTGTTPTHTFELDLSEVNLDISNIKTVKITCSQNDEEVLAKRTDEQNNDCIICDGYVTTRLTQEDTFLLEKCKLVEIQIRIVTDKGDVLSWGLPF